jgi:hypothetical protein
MIHRNYTPNKALALLMGRCEATHADEQVGGAFILPAYRKKETLRYKVTTEMLCVAEEYLKTGVPPLRGQLEPILMGSRGKTGRSNYKPDQRKRIR